MGDALRLTRRWVAEAVGGDLRCVDPQREIGNVVIDTRVLQAGDFFVALRGARYDGHHFVAQAFEKGAGGAIVGILSRIFWLKAPRWSYVVLYVALG